MKTAQQLAVGGRLVVVGAKSSELRDTNGHVAVIIPRMQGGSPLTFGGAKNDAARSQGDKTLNYVFRREFLTLLRYYAAPAATVPAVYD